MPFAPNMWCRCLALPVLLFAASSALAAGHGTLAISVTVIRSIAVTVSGGSEPSVSVRAPDGARWSVALAKVRAGQEAGLSSRPGPAGEADYLVVTILADAASTPAR